MVILGRKMIRIGGRQVDSLGVTLSGVSPRFAATYEDMHQDGERQVASFLRSLESDAPVQLPTPLPAGRDGQRVSAGPESVGSVRGPGADGGRREAHNRPV